MTATQAAPAKAIGGGSAGDMSAISAALQQLVQAVQALTAALGGVSGGGAVQQGAAQLSPAPSSAVQYAPIPASIGQYATMDSKTLLGPKVVDAAVQNAQTAQIRYNADGSVAKSLFNRPVPEDRAKGQAVVQRLMQSTAKYQDPVVAQAAGFDFTKHKLEAGGLLHVSRKGDGLNLDDPNMLLYRKTDAGLQLIGVVLTANRTAPDLGVGTWHTHFGNTDLMKHIWFAPSNLDVAFSESTPTPAQV